MLPSNLFTSTGTTIETMTRGATTASIVALLLLGLSQRAIGHGVQVRRCITEDGSEFPSLNDA